MIKEKKRKEVMLEKETIELLQQKANQEGRKLKNYMEHILKEKAHEQEFEITEEYKAMMDETLEKHARGEINYISWEEVQAKYLNRKR